MCAQPQQAAGLPKCCAFRQPVAQALCFSGENLNIDHELVARRVIELSGGKDKLNKEMDSKLAKFNEKWNQDIDAIGRILRAHLFVEYFITECLVSFNPSLGDVKETRLTFS
jgi:hypothetical protein